MKILLVQLRRIGDILLTTPALSYLKSVLPKAQIDFLTEPMGRPVLEKNPHIQDLLIYDKTQGLREIFRVRRKKYDAVIDLMGNPRTAWLTALSGAKHRVAFKHLGRCLFYNQKFPTPSEPEYVGKRKVRLIQNWVKKMGLKAEDTQDFRPELVLTREDLDFADRWREKEKMNEKEFVVISPTHRHPIRQWRWEGFQALAEQLNKNHQVKTFLAWGPSEEGLVSKMREGHESTIGQLPQTTIRQMAAIFKQAKFLVTNDSGPMHLAVSVGTPTVTVYGPTRPIDWNPGGTDVAITAPTVACLGCHLLRCPHGHLCMTEVKAQDVYRACREFL